MSDEQGATQWEALIAMNPEILGGKPVIAGTRLAVDFILDLLAGGHSLSDILDEWPGITQEQVLACIAYARDTVREIRVLEYRLHS